MDVSISQAAKMAGVTRATFYRHIDKKGISVSKDDEGNPKVNVSELIRVYGDKIQHVKQSDTGRNTSNDAGLNTPKQVEGNTPVSAVQPLELLEEQNAFLKQELEKANQYHEELREDLNDQKEQNKRITLLLENHSKEKGASDDWRQSIKELEKRIVNQEQEVKANKAQAERYLKAALKFKKERNDAEEKYEVEKSKSVWQKLFR